ncbi:hypothetical protein H8959_014229, partial [Pygathrix nigripes]
QVMIGSTKVLVEQPFCVTAANWVTNSTQGLYICNVRSRESLQVKLLKRKL